MEQAQTKLIHKLLLTCLPLSTPAPSHLHLVVTLRPSHPPSSYTLSIFCWFFKKLTTIKMSLVRTNGVSAIIACARTRDNQRPWPARCSTYWPVAHAERKIQIWKGLATAKGIWEGDYPLISCRCCVDVIYPSSQIAV